MKMARKEKNKAKRMRTYWFITLMQKRILPLGDNS